MKYYVNEGKLYSTCCVLSDSSFSQITKEEYENRMKTAKETREQGVAKEPYYESEVEIWRI